MSKSNTTFKRQILAGLSLSGLDRIYQQLDNELGMILTFHHVRPDEVPEFAPNAHLTVCPEFLDAVIVLLKERGFDIVSLDEAHTRISSPVRGTRFAVLTFDDGYRDTLDHAVPVLQRHGVPYTVYVAPGLIEGTADLWWEGIEMLVRQHDHISYDHEGECIELDSATPAAKHKCFEHLLMHLINNVPETEQRKVVRDLCSSYEVDLDGLLRREMMDWSQVQVMNSDPLCTIGAHTRNHQALARLTDEQAYDEVALGAKTLEVKLGQRPRHFAYPYGYREAAANREFSLVQALDFKTAVTTRAGMVFEAHKDHLTALPRISVNGLYQNLRYFSPLTTGLPTRLSTGLRRLDVA